MVDMRARLKERSAGVTFKARIGLWSAITMGLGSLMGAGLYVLVGLGASLAGPALWLSFAACGLLALPSALMYAELSRMIPKSGGGYLYAYQELGAFWGFMVGWLLAVGSVFACALYALGLASYAAAFLPQSLSGGATVTILALAAIWAVAGMGLRGGVGGERVQSVLTWGNVAVLAVLVLGSLFVVEVDNVVPHLPMGITGVGSAIALIYISFFGYQLIANSSEEVVDPEQTVPRAMIMALLIALCIYVTVVLVAALAVPWEELAKSDAPLVLVATAGLGPWGAALIGVGAILASGGALNGTMISKARQFYAMGRDRMLPRRIGKLNPDTGVPATALLAGAAATSLVVLSANLEFVARAANFALLSSMLPLSFALSSLQRKAANQGHAISKRQRAMPWLAFAANLALLGTLGAESLMVGGLLVGAGLGVFIAYAQQSALKGRSGLSVALTDKDLPPMMSRGERILVPLSNPETREALFTIALAMLPSDEGELIPLTIVLARAEVSLADALREHSEREDAVVGLEAVQQLAERQGSTVRPMIRAARALGPAIHHVAQDERCRLVIMGYNADDTGNRILEDIMSALNADLVLYAWRHDRPCLRIGVSLGGTINLPLMVRVAGALCEHFKGAVTYLSIVPEDLSDKSLAMARDTQIEALQRHTRLVPYTARLGRSDNPLGALVEASEDFDLLIVGAARNRLSEDATIGPFSSELARRARCNVVIVRAMPAAERFLRAGSATVGLRSIVQGEEPD